jgi:ubiquinone/menaquinone biosynthesis C-methylase UbiE
MARIKRYGSHTERFDNWSHTYEKSFTWKYFFNPIHELLASEIGDMEGAAVIDIGCGTGALLERLEERGAARLVGVDTSAGMLDIARERASGRPQMEFINGSAESLPVPDSDFDVAVSCVAFHHFPDPEKALKEVERVLKNDGRFFLCDMSGEGILARIMLAYGRLCATDTHYYERASLVKLVAAAGFVTTGTNLVHHFPPAMLMKAYKPG